MLTVVKTNKQTKNPNYFVYLSNAPPHHTTYTFHHSIYYRYRHTAKTLGFFFKYIIIIIFVRRRPFCCWYLLLLLVLIKRLRVEKDKINGFVTYLSSLFCSSRPLYVFCSFAAKIITKRNGNDVTSVPTGGLLLLINAAINYKHWY